MVENVGRKVLFLAIVLAVSLGFLVVPDEPFQLGLDLQGGTRLVYRFDLDEAVREGQITEQEAQDPAQLLSQVVSIIRNRVDPRGLLEATIRPEGTDRVVIELPGSPEVSGTEAAAALAEPLGTDDWTGLALDPDDPGVADFPDRGGVVRIGAEKIRYAQRDGSRLLDLQRGHFGTQDEVTDHPAGAAVQLSSDDAIREIIENLGELEFAILARDGDVPDLDLEEERRKLGAWVAENPGASLVNFNQLRGEEDGPHPRIRWVPWMPQDEADELRSELDRAMPLLVQEDDDWEFRGEDVDAVYATSDDTGLPAVGFQMAPNRRGDFGRFTGEFEGRQLVITLNDEAVSWPSIEERLPGRGIIRGNFTQQEVLDLVTIIRSGSLPIRPVLEHEEIVGPTLGKEYVKRGTWSGVLGLAVVVVFMIAYYRRLGIFASVGLATSILILLGGLSFLDATLTLPGIAGVILTVGMAVDANILIFDRVREELDKGQNVRQAAKTGFEKAFSAIFDANVTTLLTALILYRFGTGPVKGFAVTLSIGIIASMISALVLTRLLVHFSLERGTRAFPMGTWLVKANYDFLGKAKLAGAVSAVVVVASLVLFTVLPESTKLGIDFLGGAEVVVRTAEPMDTDAMRARVAAIPGQIGESAEVKPVADSEEEGGYRAFRVAFKVEDQGVDRVEGAEAGFEGEIRRSLADLLQPGPIEVAGPVEEGTVDRWDVKVWFEREHPLPDVHERLAAVGLQAPQLAPGDSPLVLAGTVESSGMSRPAVEAAVARAFSGDAEDSGGVPFELSRPIPSSSLVGPQVVGELRNKAIIALAVSLFVTVLYIRVRFAEYSYGIAAVAAVAHDVAVTLGILSLVNWLGWISAEINLPMIAAFLTIIGYSLNDTIVIFDRVRENLPRMKRPLRDVLNLSVNQTLSRTILTSLTTFLAVALLFGFNYGTGNTLEGFAFAMLVGIVTGSYSTIFIANPILLWLESRPKRRATGQRVAAASPDRGDESEVPARA